MSGMSGITGIQIEETTQKMHFKDMIYQGKKPQGAQSQANLFYKQTG